MRRRMRSSVLAIAAVMLVGGACDSGTGRLTAAQERRFKAERVVRRADDVAFRYTRDPGGRSQSWEDRRASVILTDSTLFIHKNEKVGLEITLRSRREMGVARSGERVRIRSGRGKSEEIWSFVPPADAGGWTTDIRGFMRRMSNPPK
ncbi:MAG: hypothetical protein ABIS03_09655 [Gemmatimonadaceae bacterium]